MSIRYKVLIAGLGREAVGRYKAMPVWNENSFEIADTAANGQDALMTFQKNKYELVVCYDSPPMTDAVLLIREISRQSRGTVFIVISRVCSSERMREAFLLGALDYLTDPVSETQLNDALSRARGQLDRDSAKYEYMETVEEYFTEMGLENSGDKFISELREFISGCENMTATTEYAADYFRYNKDYFGRLFKSRVGMTFGEFYKRFRIRYAEKLLSSGRYKVYEVSEMMGFASVDYFSSVFRRVSGKRPSEVKKNR